MEIEISCKELSKMLNSFGMQQITPYSDGTGLLINFNTSGDTLELRSVDLSGKILQNGMEWQWSASLPQNSDLIKMEIKS